MGMIGAAVVAAPAFATPAIAAPTPSRGPTPADTRASVPTVQHYVDLNSANPKELMTLPGIDAAQADRIVANRPYLTKTDLVTKNVLPVGPFLSLKYLVVALPATVSKGRR
jgi:DNA uptake protein ComE-like DNA-binding protein